MLGGDDGKAGVHSCSCGLPALALTKSTTCAGAVSATTRVVASCPANAGKCSLLSAVSSDDRDPTQHLVSYVQSRPVFCVCTVLTTAAACAVYSLAVNAIVGESGRKLTITTP
jgi:hypothetical protein